MSKGILEDRDVASLLARPEAFRHLAAFDLSENYLSADVEPALLKALPQAKLHAQRYDEMMQSRAQHGSPEWATTGFRYTAIGE